MYYTYGILHIILKSFLEVFKSEDAAKEIHAPG